MKQLSPDQQLASALSRFYADPLGYVMFCFPWDTERSIQVVAWDQPWAEPYRKRYPHVQFGPDKWACEFLDRLGDEIKQRKFNGRDAVDPIRFATASGHGIGKSTLTAWLIKFILDTRPFSKGIVTAMTQDQLKTKTWAELGKWHRISLTKDWFEYSAGRGSMSLKHKRHPETWRADAHTSKEENSEAFAGQHAANSTSFYIFDEASGIAEKIFEVRDGGLTDGEPMVFDFGNPTRNSGTFYEECAGKLRHRYICRQIDSRDVTITNKDYLQQMIDDYGIDSDRVKVRVLGQFPALGSAQFISTEAVVRAQMRPDAQPDRTAPLVIGVDVARFGDDETVIWPRIGIDCRSFEPERYSGLTIVDVANRVAAMVYRFRNLGLEPAAIFVDGTGLGAGVVDVLRAMGFPVLEVNFGGGATDKTLYRFKSDEIWGNMRDEIERRLILPKPKTPIGEELNKQLTQREFGYTKQGNKVHLESKDEMKDRGIGSPDLADALAITFAQEVAPRGFMQNAQPMTVKHDYDPLTPSF